MRKKFPIIIVIVCVYLLNARIFATDVEKEQRWSAQIISSLMVGKAEWLTANNQKFLALYAPANTAKVQGGVILLHGLGVHPNWADVIYPLRTTLPDTGWSSLSIQMPILANSASIADYIPLFDEVPGRIKAAVSYLKKQKIDNIIIVSHSFGGTMASFFMANTASHNIRAFVGIGLSSSLLNNKLDTSSALSTLNIPILDLYGSRDLDSVLNSAHGRKKSARKAGNKKYRQIVVEGADHFFTGFENQLVTQVNAWIKKNATGVEISKSTKQQSK